MNNVFILADTDNTGSISEEDITRAHDRAHGLALTLDGNRDGVINRYEVEQLYNFFHAVDKDGDGTVTLADVQDAVTYGNDLISFFGSNTLYYADTSDIDNGFDELKDLYQQANLDDDSRMSRTELFNRVVFLEDSQAGDEADIAH